LSVLAVEISALGVGAFWVPDLAMLEATALPGVAVHLSSMTMPSNANGRLELRR
jgi:hypothetical protein